jgi:cytochrome b561
MKKHRDTTRYGTAAIVLHWTIAALILFNLYVGLKYSGLESLQLFRLAPFKALAGSPLVFGLPFDPAKGLAAFTVLQLHKSLGFTVLALSLVRLALRLTFYPPPPEPESLTPLEKIASGVVHWGFYAIMLGLPITGWVIVSAARINIPTLYFNVEALQIPHLGFIRHLPRAQRLGVEAQFVDLHVRLVNVTFALLLLHIGAALKHQFIDRDAVLGRMIPFLRPGQRPL